MESCRFALASIPENVRSNSAASKGGDQHSRRLVDVQQVRDRNAVGTEDRRDLPQGDHDCIDIEVHAEKGSVQRPQSAVGIEREVARIDAALDRYLADQVGHPRVRYGEGGRRGRLDRHAERRGDMFGHRRARALRVEGHPAADESIPDSMYPSTTSTSVRVGCSPPRA